MALALCALSGLAAFDFLSAEPAGGASLRFVLSGTAIGTLGALAYWRLARRHGVERTQAAMRGPLRTVLAAAGLLVLLLGIPRCLLWLGSRIWR